MEMQTFVDTYIAKTEVPFIYISLSMDVLW